jgi:uncharacterized protein (DUF2062 family)
LLLGITSISLHVARASDFSVVWQFSLQELQAPSWSQYVVGMYIGETLAGMYIGETLVGRYVHRWNFSRYVHRRSFGHFESRWPL